MFVVRYRERVSPRKMVYRCIYVGDRGLARRARGVIQEWQRDRRRLELDMLYHYDVIALAKRYSGRARQRLLSKARSTFGDRRAMLRFAHASPDDLASTGKRPGRPPKSGLC